MNKSTIPRIPTLKEIDIREKDVFVRTDINVSVDPDTKKISVH